MYRKYFPSSKTPREVSIINKNARKDLKYCNGNCQMLLRKSMFHPNDRHYPSDICRSCNSYKKELQEKEAQTKVLDISNLVYRPSVSPIDVEEADAPMISVSLLDFPLVSEELASLRKQLSESKNQLKKTERKYMKLLEKRNYYKFEKGPALYILEIQENVYKVGYDDVNVNVRFQTYRTLVPRAKAKYIVFARQAKLLEQSLLQKYEDNKVENNHEVLAGLELKDIIDTVTTQISFLNIEANVVSGDQLQKYNDTL